METRVSQRTESRAMNRKSKQRFPLHHGEDDKTSDQQEFRNAVFRDCCMPFILPFTMKVFIMVILSHFTTECGMWGEKGLNTLYFCFKVVKQLDRTFEFLPGGGSWAYIQREGKVPCDKTDCGRFYYCSQISPLLLPRSVRGVYFLFMFTYLLGHQWIYNTNNGNQNQNILKSCQIKQYLGN